MSKIYKLNEEHVFKGLWWAKENPQNKISGTLSYKPNQRIVLEIIGNLDQEHIFSKMINRVETPLVYGQDSEGNNITLFCSFLSSKQNTNCEFAIERYQVSYAVIGKHIESENEVENYNSSIQYINLSNWCPPKKLNRGANIEGIVCNFTCSVNTESKDHFEVALGEGIDMRISSHVEINNSYLSFKTIEYTDCCFSSVNGISLKNIIHYSNVFEQFLSVAMLKRIVPFSFVLFEKQDKEDYYQTISLLYWEHNDFLIDDVPTNYLFSFNDVQKELNEIIPNWFVINKELYPLTENLINSFMINPVFQVTDFTAVAYSLDGFWKRFRKKEWQKKHNKQDNSRLQYSQELNELIIEFSNIDKVSAEEIDLKEVVDSRDYYSHFMERSEDKSILEGRELLILKFKLRKILLCCILSVMGFNNERINKMLNSCNHNMLYKTTWFS